MSDTNIYEERLFSNKTEALFIGLTLLFLILSLWRLGADHHGFLTTVFLFLTFFFFFYSVNFRILMIHLDSESLELKFGIFTWEIQLDNIDECRLDDLPIFMKYGGAGIHFMLIRGRYRVSFNFLEHPRVVISLEKRAGPVRDISFSTSHPDELIRLIRAAASAWSAT
jgi:hypothetical protein